MEQNEIRTMIDQCRKAFEKNTRQAALLNAKTSFQGEVLQQDVSEMEQIFNNELYFLNKLIQIVDQENDIILKSKNEHAENSSLVKEAQSLFNDRKGLYRLKLGFGYTPYFSGINNDTSSLTRLQVDYELITIFSLEDRRDAVALSEIGY